MATTLLMLALIGSEALPAANAEVKPSLATSQLNINNGDISLDRYRVPLYELIEPGNISPGKIDPYEPHYAALFKKMLAPGLKHDRELITRITSGPSTRGEIVSIDDQAAVIHVICQQHRCEDARLAVLYRPIDKRMVGLLWDKCKLQELGIVRPAEREMLIRLGKMPVDASAVKCINEKSRS